MEKKAIAPMHLDITWKDDYKNSLRSYKEINSFFNLRDNEAPNYSCFLPISFAHKIKKSGMGSPLWKQFIHAPIENSKLGLIDPIGDKEQAKGHGIIHRYKNRILFTPTTNCPIICRYCFRKNELSNQDERREEQL